MRLLIKQKVFSWADKFLVKDEYGGDRYNVQGEIFSLGHRLHIYDYSGREVALIQQKLFSFKPRYFIFINGVQVAELVKQFTMFKQKYIVEGQEWSLEGDFWSHDYRLMKDDGSVIMSVKKEWFTWGDSYALDIQNDVNDLLCLCIVLAVDCTNENNSGSNTSFFSN